MHPNVGDHRIVITNNYKALRGSKGTIIGSTEKQFNIRLDTGHVINRAKSNIALYDNNKV